MEIRVREAGPRCAACGEREGSRRPSRAWWLVVVFAWAVLLLFGACAALMLPLNLVLVPAWLSCAMAVGPLARRLTEPRCRACGASWAPAAEVARRLAGPADERAVEGALVGEPDEERHLGDRVRATA
jgi:hypothetical protein